MTGPGNSTGARRRLPIGVQTFREIREENCYYVDKTDYLRRLAEGGKHYFLSRPRRFGKSLFLDTCKELFEGESLLNHLAGDSTRGEEHSARLYDLLLVNDFAGLEALFRGFLAGIPYQWHMNNDIAGYEGYYASVFYSCFAGLGLDVAVEDSTSHGRLDMAVLFNGS